MTENNTSCSQTHCLYIEKATKRVFSYMKQKNGNRFGQLGRKETSLQHHSAPVEGIPEKVKQVSAGGDKDAGHSAALTELGNVYVWGCDRWQQLGLGSADAGGVGYTWEGGRLWQNTPQRAWVKNIKHIACGSDHTVALSKDGSTVYTWGRGEHGQLGRKHKLFVGAPAPSPILSAQSGSQNVEFVLAVGNCSASCAKDGSIIAKAGKCKGIINKAFNAAIISNKKV